MATSQSPKSGTIAALNEALTMSFDEEPAKIICLCLGEKYFADMEPASNASTFVVNKYNMMKDAIEQGRQRFSASNQLVGPFASPDANKQFINDLLDLVPQLEFKHNPDSLEWIKSAKQTAESDALQWAETLSGTYTIFGAVLGFYMTFVGVVYQGVLANTTLKCNRVWGPVALFALSAFVFSMISWYLLVKSWKVAKAILTLSSIAKSSEWVTLSRVNALENTIMSPPSSATSYTILFGFTVVLSGIVIASSVQLSCT